MKRANNNNKPSIMVKKNSNNKSLNEYQITNKGHFINL